MQKKKDELSSWLKEFVIDKTQKGLALSLAYNLHDEDFLFEPIHTHQAMETQTLERLYLNGQVSSSQLCFS